MAGCREIRQALGVYVLGAIDPAERAQVEEHLATAPSAARELRPGRAAALLLGPGRQAERLAVAGRIEFAVVPSPEIAHVAGRADHRRAADPTVAGWPRPRPWH
jgi:anti-sigma factor RsiW